MNNSVSVPNTEISIFPVILGTAMSGTVYDEKTAAGIVDNFLGVGGNAIDTARVYSGGKSESFLGNIMKKNGRRNDIVLITKGGHPRLDSMSVSRMRPEDMREDLEQSLHALQTDWIDIYYYHVDNENQPVEVCLQIMEDFVKEGKIRYYGCSNWKTERIEEAVSIAHERKYHGFVVNQPLFNIASDVMNPFPIPAMVTMDEKMKEFHEKTGILVTPYFGACSGFFHHLAKHEDEKLKDSPYYTEGVLSRAEKIFRLCEQYNASITQVLLSFFFYQSFTACPIYGPVKPEQVFELEQLLQIPFTENDFSFS